MAGLNRAIPVNGRGLYIGNENVIVTVPAVDIVDKTVTIQVTMRNVDLDQAICVDLPDVQRLINISLSRIRTSSQVELHIEAPREIEIGEVV